MSSCKVLWMTGIAVSAIALASPAMASDVPVDGPSVEAGNPEGSVYGDDIVVSARKRDESMSTVPISITAYTAESLKERNISNLADLSNTTPGISITSIAGGTAQNIYLRGLAPANTSNDLNVEANVGVFIDGIYQSSRNTLDMMSILDVGQIEVLKGPQSSLMGRSTFAGALNISTGRPTRDRQIELSATIGNYDDYRVRGVVSGPISDTVLARFAAGYVTYDGWRTNEAEQDNRLGGTRKYGASGALEFSNGGPFSARLAGFFTHSESELQPISLLPLASYNCGAVNAAGAKQYFCGSLIAPDKTSVTAGIPRTKATTRQLTLEMRYELEGVEFVSTTGVTGAENRAFNDFDASAEGPLFGICTAGAACFPAGAYARTAHANLVSTSVERVRTIGTELRIQSTGEKVFNWLAGVNYFKQKIPLAGNGIGASSTGLTAGERFVQVSQLGTVPATGVGGYDFIANPYTVADSNADQTFANWAAANTRTWSAFGGIQLHLGRVRFNAEGRYNIDRKDAQVFSVANPTVSPGIYPSISGTTVPAAATFPVAGPRFEGTFKSFTPRFTLDYRPVDNVFVYASAAKGVRSGGFNTANPVGPTGILAQESVYDEESNWTYEAGFKAHMLQGAWRFDASYFRVDWENAQVSSYTENPTAVNPVRIVRNIGRIRATGFEILTEFNPIQGLTFGGSAIYSNSRFREGAYDASAIGYCVIGTGAAAVAAPGCPPVILVKTASGATRAVPSLEGLRTQRSVKWQWHTFAQGKFDLNDEWDATARVDVNYSGPAYADLVNAISFGKRTLTNLRLTFSNDQYTVSLWGKNVFDTKYVVNSIVQPRAGLPITLQVPELYLGETRRFGISAGVKF